MELITANHSHSNSMHSFPLQRTFTPCLASVNLVYSAPYFKIIIVIKGDIPDEVISFTSSARVAAFSQYIHLV